MLATQEVTRAEVLKFLVERNYTIDISRIQRGCLVKFPERVLGPEWHESVSYKVTTEKGVHGVRITIGKQKAFIPVPIYACRAFIFFDIVGQCLQIGYDADFIRFFDSDKCLGTLDDITFNEFLKEGFGEDVRKKEQQLWDLFTHSLNNGFPEKDLENAENLGLIEGYFILYESFNDGE